MKKDKRSINDLLDENKKLRRELTKIKKQLNLHPKGPTVSAPRAVSGVFAKAQRIVGEYFSDLRMDPERGTIEVEGQRYVLVRASALSYEFMNTFKKLYSDIGETAAVNIANNFLFDMAHLIGKEDAKNLHEKMSLIDPIEKLSAGPVHFAYTGWAYVDILPESKPSPDENYYLKFKHPFSFEADSWIKAKKKSNSPVCIMNSGYSSGWCSESFGIPLTTVEITCKARGDSSCTFIMAPPQKIENYIGKEIKKSERAKLTVHTFMERKKIEEELRQSLSEKELLLKEIHHRVKNNLQVISSLLNLQAGNFPDNEYREKMLESIRRVRSMAIVHELLYRSGDLSNIVIEDYFTSLVSIISGSYSLDTGVRFKVKVETRIKTIDIDKAIPAGLILNEMISNSIKYAFPDKQKGKITITFADNMDKSDKKFELTVEDNGIGIPESISYRDPDSFGLQIINALVSQLSGTINLDTQKGTKFIVRF